MRILVLVLAISMLTNCGPRFGLSNYETGTSQTYNDPRAWRNAQKKIIEKRLAGISPIKTPLAKRVSVILPSRKQIEEAAVAAGFSSMPEEAFKIHVAMDEDIWGAFADAVRRSNIFERIQVSWRKKPTPSMTPNGAYLIWIEMDDLNSSATNMYITHFGKKGYFEFPSYSGIGANDRFPTWLKDVEVYVTQNPVTVN
jgi:hypothetical protein